MTTTIRQTRVFSAWLADLRDVQAKARINARIRRLSLGNPGQHRVLQGGVAELKIDYGPGYRVYYTQRGEELVILLCGGDKRTQTHDIERAISMAGEV
ncbi:type II toxin-antitoxin system RelE/ParE family toxin [Methylobacterium sp. J-067]|uniref:type II toxin-antitoxin system RelE/ParE family toxin n=1 Tax=Methylobacterium sp. J-067 TaxID=2836648 RepID=UPI001FBBBC32|nr:type II toxin-antitoxin system RelE/ParE family toxin [Methylobacterium sp. J-067]MCJ2024659.1 type II toxin-antitoxin system RelE/ParE family toxin [Methylobacterium sp. J-067]